MTTASLQGLVGMVPRIGLAVARVAAHLALSLFLLSSAEAGTPAPSSSSGRSLSATRDSLALLVEAARYPEADALAGPLLERTENEHGRESLEVARVLDLMVVSRRRGGKANHPETLELAKEAVRIKEGLPDPDLRELAMSLCSLALLHHTCGRFAAAEPFYERALDLRRRSDGPDHPDYALVLSSLASLLADTGRVTEARALLEQACATLSAKLPPDDFAIANCLNKQANLLNAAGEFAAAQPLYERALAIARKALSDEHPRTAAIAYNYCHLLRSLGNHDAAIDCFESRLESQIRTLGPEHHNVALTIASIGQTRSEIGDYAGAMPYFERAIAINRENGEEDHPDARTILDAFAFLLDRIGDYERAEEMFERSLASRTKVLGENNEAVAHSHLFLGALYTDLGRFDEARASFQTALEIFTTTQGENGPWVGWTLCDMGILATRTGDADTAGRHFERALPILEESLGSDAPSVAWLLFRYGSYLRSFGETERASEILARAADIFENAAGYDYHLANVLSGQAHCLATLGREEEALQLALRAEEIGSDHLRRTAPALAERQAFLYADVRASGHDLALSLVAARFRDRPAAVRAVWDRLIRSRALVLEEMVARHHAVAGDRDEGAALQADSLRTIRQRLAVLTIRGPSAEKPETYLKRLDEMRREKESLERALSRLSLTWRDALARSQTELRDVQERIPRGSALVAFVQYDEFPIMRDQRSSGAVPAYLALVQLGSRESPVLVPLGEAAVIDSLVARWRRELDPAKVAGIDSHEGAELRYRRVGESLRRAIWDPVARYLESVDRVFLVPDGTLNLVNLAALPTGETSYLVEDGPLLHHLSAERDLCSLAEETAFGHGLLVVAGPDFDASSPDPGRAESAEIPDPNLLTLRGERLGCLRELESHTFEPLPETVLEADLIARLWNEGGGHPDPGDQGSISPATRTTGEITRLTGERATESALKALAPNKRILHLATHGFFLGGSCSPTVGGLRGWEVVAASHHEFDETQATSPRPAIPPPTNPMLLSGLVLAGANHRHAGPLVEDGILTAEEIASLPLDGVEWAVLSACDTGMGEVRAGEGILGLRRAFRIAGARTVIMSLWSVEDTAAREWMEGLYKARLLDRLSTAESVRRATLQFLNERRQAGRSTHPFTWGAFVAAGDWR